MDIKDLNKSQLILLAVLLSFVTSVATGITTVTLMQQAPESVRVPVTRIVRETVEKIVPIENNTPKAPALSAEEKKILEDLKAIKPLTVTLLLKGETKDKILGTGLFLGNNKVVVASVIAQPAEGQVYAVKSILGEQTVFKVTVEKDFTIIELAGTETEPIPVPLPDETANADGSSVIPITEENTIPAAPILAPDTTP